MGVVDSFVNREILECAKDGGHMQRGWGSECGARDSGEADEHSGGGCHRHSWPTDRAASARRRV